MIVKFHCPDCGQRIAAGPAEFNTEGNCPACGHVVVVPNGPANALLEAVTFQQPGIEATQADEANQAIIVFIPLVMAPFAYLLSHGVISGDVSGKYSLCMGLFLYASIVGVCIRELRNPFHRGARWIPVGVTIYSAAWIAASCMLSFRPAMWPVLVKSGPVEVRGVVVPSGEYFLLIRIGEPLERPEITAVSYRVIRDNSKSYKEVFRQAGHGSAVGSMGRNTAEIVKFTVPEGAPALVRLEFEEAARVDDDHFKLLKEHLVIDLQTRQTFQE